jgi:hypothetical protein
MEESDDRGLLDGHRRQNNTAAGGSSSVSGGDLVVQSAGFGWSAGSIGSAVSGSFSSP